MRFRFDCWFTRCFLLLAVTTVALTVSQGTAAEKPSHRNVVVIVADDLGYGDLSCYGCERYQTPFLDQMAAEGMKWSDFHSNGNVCSPTRAALLTGQYQQRWGVDRVITAAGHRDRGLPLEAVTFAETFSQHGYATAIYGKWHQGYQARFNPVRQGFDHFVGYVSGNVDFQSHIDQAGQADWWHNDELTEEAGYVTHLITQYAVKFIEDNKEQPFCLYLPHETPHYPYQGPNDPADRTVGGKFVNHGSRDDKAAAYAEMMIEMDRGIGEVLQTLQKHGLAEQTLVLFFSDNGGTSLGDNGGLRGTKGSDWEGGHRVPMIAWNPETVPAGSDCDQLAITHDIFPTLADYADLPLPKDQSLDGISLLPYLEAPKRETISRELVWNGNAIRDGNWKLIRKAKGIQQPHLFNLEQDLAEQNNLAEKHPQKVQQLTRKLNAWQASIDDSLETRGVTPVSQPVKK